MTKVIDCFPFFNELDLLEIRLNELKDVVDVFVLTESPLTFTGKDKPLFFEENWPRFEDFKIVSAVHYDSTACHPMERERRQKQYNLDYAYDNVFEPGDVIMFGDCDEIPKASAVKEALALNLKSVGLQLPLYYYYLNCRQINAPFNNWPSVMVTRPDKKMVYDLSRKNPSDHLIPDAGYHFSYLGDIKYKLSSWGHANQFDRPPYNDPEHIKKCVAEGKDFLMRRGNRSIRLEFIQDLSYLPKYVLENLDKYEQYIHR